MHGIKCQRFNSRIVSNLIDISKFFLCVRPFSSICHFIAYYLGSLMVYAHSSDKYGVDLQDQVPYVCMAINETSQTDRNDELLLYFKIWEKPERLITYYVVWLDNMEN